MVPVKKLHEGVCAGGERGKGRVEGRGERGGEFRMYLIFLVTLFYTK